jgi:hypothetical protein
MKGADERPASTGRRIVGADARPSWKEQPLRESVTEVQWRSRATSSSARDGGA